MKLANAFAISRTSLASKALDTLLYTGKNCRNILNLGPGSHSSESIKNWSFSKVTFGFGYTFVVIKVLNRSLYGRKFDMLGLLSLSPIPKGAAQKHALGKVGTYL